jgi:hypothetical protein
LPIIPPVEVFMLFRPRGVLRMAAVGQKRIVGHQAHAPLLRKGFRASAHQKHMVAMHHDFMGQGGGMENMLKTGDGSSVLGFPVHHGRVQFGLSLGGHHGTDACIE